MSAWGRPSSPIGIDTETRNFPRAGSDIYQIGSSAGFNVTVHHPEVDGWTRTHNPALAAAVPKSTISQCEAVRRFMAHISELAGVGRKPFLVGHSVVGDINALFSAAQHCGVPYPREIFIDDTHDQCAGAGAKGSCTLAACYERITGKPLANNHDAEADAIAAHTIYDPRRPFLRLLSFEPSLAGPKMRRAGPFVPEAVIR